MKNVPPTFEPSLWTTEACAEGLLSYCIGVAIKKGKTVGEGWKYPDPDKRKRNPLTWDLSAPEATIEKQSFFWLIRVSHEFGIVDQPTEVELQWVRNQRNTVHLRQRASIGNKAYLNQSARAFKAVHEVIRQTKVWMASV